MIAYINGNKAFYMFLSMENKLFCKKSEKSYPIFCLLEIIQMILCGNSWSHNALSKKKPNQNKNTKNCIDTCYYSECSFYKWLYILTGLWSNCAIIKLQKLPLKIAHSGSLDRTKHPNAKTPGKIAATFWKSLSSMCNIYLSWDERK